MRIDELLERLNKVKKTGDNRYMALCPAHKDTNRSLAIKGTDDGTILTHCFAGCSHESIIAKLGLELKDLFPDKTKNPGMDIVALYDYRKDDELQYQIVRLSPKSFRVRRPDGKDGWIWDSKGAELIPYHYDDVQAAIKQEHTILIVEGEKDADRLKPEGFAATTNPFGAGKWPESFAKFFKGAKVVVIADNDKKGWDHAVQVAAKLKKTATSIKMIDKLPGVPEKGDAYDFFEAGGTVKELVDLILATPEYVPAGENSLPITRLSLVPEPPPLRHIVEDICPENYITILHGDGGQGKSYITLALAMSVVTGRQFIGKQTVQGNALYLDFELDEAEQARRAYKVARGYGLERVPDGLLYLRPGHNNVPTSFGLLIPQLSEYIKSNGVVLVVIDSFGAAAQGDPESARDVTQLFQSLAPLGTALILDHQSKAPGIKTRDKSAFGSVYKFNLSRNVYQLQLVASEENTTKLALHHKKSNFGPLRKTLGLECGFGDAFTIKKIELDADFATAEALSIEDEVIMALNELGRATNEQIAEHASEILKTVRNITASLKKKGRIIETGEKIAGSHVLALASKDSSAKVTISSAEKPATPKWPCPSCGELVGTFYGTEPDLLCLDCFNSRPRVEALPLTPGGEHIAA